MNLLYRNAIVASRRLRELPRHEGEDRADDGRRIPDLVRRQERVDLLPRDELEHAGGVRDAAVGGAGELLRDLRHEARFRFRSNLEKISFD